MFVYTLVHKHIQRLVVLTFHSLEVASDQAEPQPRQLRNWVMYRYMLYLRSFSFSLFLSFSISLSLSRSKSVSLIFFLALLPFSIFVELCSFKSNHFTHANTNILNMYNIYARVCMYMYICLCVC